MINVLENWFSKSYSSTRWGNNLSTYVPLLAGVRQWGILSPLPFSLFVDVILKKLEDSDLGCYINFQSYNSCMYADDIILLSISVHDLHLMFNLCSNVFADSDLPINVSKSHCLRIGPRCNVACRALRLNKCPIEWADSTKFL